MLRKNALQLADDQAALISVANLPVAIAEGPEPPRYLRRCVAVAHEGLEKAVPEAVH